jgi:hypothetical protein
MNASVEQAQPQKFLLQVYRWLLIAPLQKLYFGGPQVYGWGFWGGRARADMCAELTSYDAYFWHQHAAECDQLLERQFGAFLIAIETLLYLYLLYKAVGFLLRIVLWRLKIAPESWRRTPPMALQQAPAINFRASRNRSPQPRRGKKNLD